jgi:uncharacterized membrane protein/mono/diheme cytochrome c family protein
MLLFASLLLQAGAAPAASPEAFFDTRIRPIFESTCLECHGPRKQKSGLRLDSRESVLRGGHGPIVTLGDPDRSRLIDAVSYEDGELQMPPDGKLSDQQIADFRQWVKMGVPWGSAAAPADTNVASRAEKPKNPEPRLVLLAGRVHPLVTHFPVALILSSAFAELLALVSRSSIRSALRGASLFCLLAGVAGALAAAATGWIHLADSPEFGSGGPAAIAELHRWLGVGTAAFGFLVCAGALLAIRRPTRATNTTYRAALFLLAASVGATAHFGGLLTHGLGYWSS